MKKISNIPYNEVVKINKNSKVVHASSFGVGGDDDEIRIIICEKKLITDEGEFKLLNESDFQIVMDKKVANYLKNLLEQYTD